MRAMCSTIAQIVERGRGEFDRDIVLPLALERALEVLGEAATNISDETQALFPSVAWTENEQAPHPPGASLPPSSS